MSRRTLTPTDIFWAVAQARGEVAGKREQKAERRTARSARQQEWRRLVAASLSGEHAAINEGAR